MSSSSAAQRGEVKKQVYASLSLRCTHSIILRTMDKKRVSLLFDLTQKETLKLIPCYSHFNWNDPALVLWDSACSKKKPTTNWWSQNALTALSSSSMKECTLTWRSPSATKLLLTSYDYFIKDGFLKDVIALTFTSMTNKCITHLSHA